MNTEEHVREDIWESFPQKTAGPESSNHKYQTYLPGIIKKKKKKSCQTQEFTISSISVFYD